MAAATENAGRGEDVEGNKYVMRCNITWTNGDTFTTSYPGVQMATFSPTTNTAAGLTYTTTSGVVTLVSGGSLTGDIMVRSTGGD